MTNWRKQQLGHRGSSSFNRKPPLPLDISTSHSTLPKWEKKFFHSVCSIPWRKFVENQRYMHINDKVMNWEDSAVKEAFDSAKMRFWAKLNDVPCSLPFPDPDIYIDKVDWDASVDPKLLQDLERDEIPSEEERGGEVVILSTSFLLNQAYSGAGWGDGWGDGDEEEATKPVEAAQGWESSPQENFETNSWEQHYVPFEPAKESNEWDQQHNAPVEYERNSWDQNYAPVEQEKGNYGWSYGQNDDQWWNRTGEYCSWQNGEKDDQGWNQRKEYGGSYFHNNKGRRRNNRGGGGGGGGGGRGRGRGRRGSFGYVPAAAGAW